MKRLTLSLLLTVAVMAPQAIAQSPQTPADMPWFLQVFPQAAHQAAWEEYQAIYGPDTAIPAKYKQLIALAVAAQVPCHYCTHAHSRAAEKAGASEDELREAVAVAALVRKWSTMLNGAEVDFDKFKATIDGAQ